MKVVPKETKLIEYPDSLADFEPFSKALESEQLDAASIFAKMAYQVENLNSPHQALELWSVAHLASGLFEYYRGGILLKIKENGWYASFGTFSDFCEEHGMKTRKAEYLMQIYKAMVNAGIPPQELFGIDWTKLRILVTKFEPDEIKQWLPKAKSMTVRQLQQVTKAIQSTSEVEKPAPIKIALPVKVFPDELEMIDAAIDRCMSYNNIKHKHQALECICLDYMAGAGHIDFKHLHPIHGACKNAMVMQHGDVDKVVNTLVEQLNNFGFSDWEFSAKRTTEGP